jgi:hypothetical protein
MGESGAHGDTDGYFALAQELLEFRAGPLGGEPSDRALGRAGGVKADTVKAWLAKGQFPQDPDSLVAVVRAVGAMASAKGIVPIGRQVIALDEGQWREAHREEARRRAGDVSVGARRGQAARALAGSAAGRPLGEVTDPFGLEVHRPLVLDDLQSGLHALTAYVAREHDRELAEVVEAAAAGISGIAVLVGGSSTGKTRACWEALGLLRKLPERWRLWHPIDPSRPEAAVREIPLIGPRTVVWLNEAQFYLDMAANGLGERVAAGLREALRDPERAPVLVLATLWPQFWHELTARPLAGADDRHAQARELLAGRNITVPAAFSADQLPQAAATGDPRLALAARAADFGQVVQFLAGAPELVARYRNAPPAAAALVSAAMDARRLGMGITVPLAFLEAAAPGYLADADWDTLPENWLEQALAYTAAPAKGTRGPLTRIRPRDITAPLSRPAYRLADYLDQYGRRIRRQHIPPASFWRAAQHFASPGDLPALASAAEARGLLRDTARLRKHATMLGDASEAAALIRLWHDLRPHSADPNPAQWVTAHITLDDPAGVASLLKALREAGADEQATALLVRDPAAHATLDDPAGVASLLKALWEAGADVQAASLASRAATHVTLDHPGSLAWLLHTFWEAGADEQVAVLLARDPAAQVTLDHPAGVASLLKALWEVGADKQATVLLARDPAAQVTLDHPDGVASLVMILREVGADEKAATLAGRAAAPTPLDDPVGVAWLLDTLQKAGAEEQAAALADLNDPDGVAWLLDTLREAGADGQAAALLARDPAAHVTLDDPDGVAWLLDTLREGAADGQAAALLARDPAAQVTLDHPAGVASLLKALWEVGADEQAAALLARDPAAHVTLYDTIGVAWLMTVLREVGADGQAAALLARDPAAHVTLHHPAGFAWLVKALREAGADEQARRLVDRLPAEGQFGLFSEQAGHRMRYRFGREPNGSPALAWSWDDLE